MNNVKFDKDEYVKLLGSLLKHVEKLQNSPPRFNAQEELAADEVVAFLKDVSGPDSPLSVRKITYKAGRSNVVLTYKSEKKDARTVSFVGSHLDVVPAAPEDWSFNPFELTREGDDKLCGRGVTDCLGHVAMLSCLFKRMVQEKVKLDVNVMAVFIANEEASAEMGIGVDELVKQGELDACKSGPLFWVDSADLGPTLATAAAVSWELVISGRKFHSGCPHKGINAVELGMEAVQYVQDRFYKDFAPHEKESTYKFAVGSSLKPTQFNSVPGPNNQVPQSVTISGDIRVTPFYEVEDVMKAVEGYVKDMNEGIEKLPTRGFSRYVLPNEGGLRGQVKLNWLGHPYKGVAVNMESDGHKALHASIDEVTGGKSNPFSLTGSLPCIRELQDDGFDVQVVGFGKMAAYHATDEYGLLSDFENGFDICRCTIEKLNK